MFSLLSASYLDLLLSIGRTVSCALPLMTNVTILTSISQTFLFWVAYLIFASLWCVYLTTHTVRQGLLLLGMFYQRAARLSYTYLGHGNIWNRPYGSSMVDMGVSSNIMKSPSPKCYMTMTPSIDQTFQTNRDIVTELDLITVMTSLLYLIQGGFHRAFATDAASQQKTLTPPDTWSCPIWDLHLF